MAGFEPAKFSCSQSRRGDLTPQHLEFCGPEGFRSLYFCVTGRYDSHFTTRPFFAVATGLEPANLLRDRQAF